MSRMRIDKIDIKDADIFEILLDNFPDMIHSVDDEGNIVYANRTATRLLGYSQEELLSMNIMQLYADEILDAVKKGFTSLKERGDNMIPESLLKTKDGTRIPVEIRSFSIYDDHGNFLRTFSILRDIRKVKDLQQSLVHASRLAAIGELASGVAHDINNPLTVILLSNDMIQRDLSKRDPGTEPLVERLASHATDIHRASKSIQKLSDHLRNFSRGMAETHQAVDLFDCINDALFMTRSKVTANAVTLNCNIKKGAFFVKGSPNQLEQVFVNLIGNACDAMAGQPTRDLTVAVSEARLEGVDCWKCEVADTGTGIPKDIQDDVFQSFFTTKEKGKGTGLGLSISRAIVKDHKGTIELNSEEGKGTTFAVLLPKVS